MRKNPKRFFALCIILVAIGAGASALLYMQIDAIGRASILNQVDAATASMSVASIESLTGDNQDLGRPAYLELKSYLTEVRESSEGARFTYIVKRDENRLITFSVDSEDPNSPDYSPPGQQYYEASENMQSVFDTGKHHSDGPLTDRWGTWISGYTPIRDSAGRVVAVFGMDFPADNHVRNTFAYSLLPFVSALVAIMILVALRLFLLPSAVGSIGGRTRMRFLMRNRTLSSRFFVPFVVFVIGSMLSVLIAGLFFQSLKDQVRIKFENDTDQIASLVQSRMSIYTNVLYGMQGFFGASEHVLEEEWVRYIEEVHIAENYRGVSSMLYIERVPKDKVPDYPYKIYPEADKQDYYPITYTYQAIGTIATSTLGFDVSSENRRALAITEATRLATPIASAVVLGVSTHIPVFSIYAPLYSTDASMLDATQRADAIVGFVTSTFRVKELFEGLVADPVFNREIIAQIYDAKTIAEAGPDTLLFDTSQHRPIQGSQKDLVRTIEIHVAGRIWTLRFTAGSLYTLGVFPSMLPWSVLFAGLLLTVFATALTYFFIVSRAQALSAKNTQLTNVISQMPFGFLLEDQNRRVLFVNENMIRVFGRTVKDVSMDTFVGADTRELARSAKDVVKDFELYTKRIEEIIAAKKPIFNEKIELAHDRFISRDYVPLIDEERHIGGMWTFKDVTEEENIDRMKTEFVSLASHQLRTPLTSIKWYTELLLDDADALSAEQQEYANEIRTASVRMNTLVAALLDISRLDLGTFMIEPEPADLIEVMAQAVSEQERTFTDKKQIFSFMHPDSVSKIPIDTKLFFIIVQNLLSNAHKYSPEGATIQLGLKRNADGSYVVSCSDTGYGVPKNQQASIFKKLFRADNIRSLDVEGTGLGLYMIKTIVDAAGCAITFTSEEGKGTTFTITIPASGMKRKEGTRTLGK